MKAVVVQVKGNRVAALMDDGQIKLVRDRNYRIGQVINVPSSLLSSLPMRARALSALTAAMLVLVFGVSSYAYFTPFSTVSIDVNPSLEFTLNRFERVLRVVSWNDEGEQIAIELQLKNKKIEEALNLAIQTMNQAGYLGQNAQNGVIVSAAFKNQGQAQALAARLKIKVEGDLEDLELDAEVESLGVGFERVEEARELGMTPGKLNLIERLQDSAINEEVYEIEDWKDTPVKEIMNEIKINRTDEKGVPGANPDSGPSTDQGQDDEDATTNGTPDNGNNTDNGKGKGKGN